MPDDFNPVAFGKVLGRLDAQEKLIEDLKKGQLETNRKLDTLLEYQAKQRGAAQVLLLAAAGVSAVVGWIVSYFVAH